MDFNFDGALKNTQGHLTFVSRKWNKHFICSCTMKSVFVAIRVVLFITKTCPCNIEKKIGCKNEIFTGKFLMFFLFLLKT